MELQRVQGFAQGKQIVNKGQSQELDPDDLQSLTAGSVLYRLKLPVFEMNQIREGFRITKGWVAKKKSLVEVMCCMQNQDSSSFRTLT